MPAGLIGSLLIANRGEKILPGTGRGTAGTAVEGLHRPKRRSC